jgi:hypothetical protein
MIKVNDIQDAVTMRKVLMGLVGRTRSFGKTTEDVIDELVMMVEDLDNNIFRIEDEMEAEYAYADDGA